LFIVTGTTFTIRFVPGGRLVLPLTTRGSPAVMSQMLSIMIPFGMACSEGSDVLAGVFVVEGRDTGVWGTVFWGEGVTVAFVVTPILAVECSPDVPPDTVTCSCGLGAESVHPITIMVAIVIRMAKQTKT
jgi:hypothetical protein